jgi:hypothetical protein
MPVFSLADSGRGIGTIDPDSHTPENLDIAEAVFRYQIQEWRTNGRKAPVYLSLFGEDPEPAFLQRFEDMGMPIRPQSQHNPDRIELILGVDEIRRLSKWHAEVHGGYYADPEAASGDLFYVVYQSGRWIVANVLNIWVAHNVADEHNPVEA